MVTTLLWTRPFILVFATTIGIAVPLEVSEVLFVSAVRLDEFI